MENYQDQPVQNRGRTRNPRGSTTLEPHPSGPLPHSAARTTEILDLTDSPPHPGAQPAEIFDLTESPPLSPLQYISTFRVQGEPGNRATIAGPSTGPSVHRDHSNDTSTHSRTRRNRSAESEERLSLDRGSNKRKRTSVSISRPPSRSGEEIDTLEAPSDDDSSDDGNEHEKATDAEREINAVPAMRYKEVSNHRLGAAVAIIPELGAFVCKICHYMVKGDALSRHFKDKKHAREFGTNHVETIGTKYGIDLTIAPPPPPPGCYPPPGLKPKPFWKCTTCKGFFIPDGVMFARHACPGKQAVEVTACLWRPNCYFEVIQESQIDSSRQQTVEEWARAKLIQLGDPLASEVLPTTAQTANIHPFLIRSGWVDFFKPIKLADLEKLKGFASLPLSDDPIRNLIHHIFQELKEQLTTPQYHELQYIIFASKGILANTAKNEAHSIEPETLCRYADQATRFLSYYLQTVDNSDCRRPHFISSAHKNAIKVYADYFQKTNPPCGDNAQQYTDNDRVYGTARQVVLDTILSFFCDTLNPSIRAESGRPADEAGDIGFDAENLVHPVTAFTILSCVSVGEVLAKPMEASRLVAALQWILRMSVWAKTRMEEDNDEKSGVSLHHRVEMESEKWCREFKGTVFSWLRGVMHLSSQFVMTENPIGRFVYAGNDEFLLDGQKITLANWKKMVKTFMDELPQAFQDLCDVVGVDESDMELPGEIRDIVDSSSVGYWLGVEQKNSLVPKANKLATKTLSEFFESTQPGEEPAPIPGKLAEYREKLRVFLKALQRALYFSGGQPPRGDNDIWGVQYRNTATRGRNLFYFEDAMVYVSSVNKTIHRYGRDAGIPHIFPPGDISRILMRYLVYFRLLEVSLATLFSGLFGKNLLPDMLSFVFVDFDTSIGTAIFTREMKIRTMAMLGLPHTGLGMADIRQTSIYISMRYLLPLVRDPDEGYRATFDVQAGHSTLVAQAHYGVEVQELPNSMKSHQYLNFKMACYLSHQFYGMADRSQWLTSMGTTITPQVQYMPSLPTANPVPVTPRKTTNPHPEIALTTPSIKRIAAQLAPHLKVVQPEAPVNSPRNVVPHIPMELVKALIKIERLPFRSETQAAATVAVHLKRHDLLCILPTGGGKSLVFQAPALVGGRTIFLVVPYRALARDQVSAARKLGIYAEEYHGGMTAENAPNIVCTVVETALSKSFQNFLRLLESTGSLHAIVLDEAHLFLSPDLIFFRPKFQQLPIVFRRFSAPLVFLTGSLPPSDEPRLAAMFNLSMVPTLRDQCRRTNISYRVDSQSKLDWRNSGAIYNYILGVTHDARASRHRILVFLPTKDLILQIKNHPGSDWISITGDDPLEQQAATLSSWGLKGTKLVLLSTSVIGTGVDLPQVRFVLHAGMPLSFRDWFQQTGRGGRDGLPSIALLNSTPPPFFRKDDAEDARDRDVLRTLVTEDQCRRITIDGHVDGKASTCFAAQLECCDYCLDLREQLIGEVRFHAPPPPTQLEPANSGLVPDDEELWHAFDEIDSNLVNLISQTLPATRSPTDYLTGGLSNDRLDNLGGRQGESSGAASFIFGGPSIRGGTGTIANTRKPTKPLSRVTGVGQGAFTRGLSQIHSRSLSSASTPTPSIPPTLNIPPPGSYHGSTSSSVTSNRRATFAGPARKSTPSAAGRVAGSTSSAGGFPAGYTRQLAPAVVTSSQPFGRATKGREDDIIRQHETMESANRQVSVMQDLKGLYCIFCLVTDGRFSQHITEKCYVALGWSQLRSEAQFGQVVRTWGKGWPVNDRATEYYCTHCRFPKTRDFHQDSDGGRSNPNGCHYNDTLNRASWAFFTNEIFFDRIFEFSNHSIDVRNMDANKFKEWLMEEPSAGCTNLFELFAYIVQSKNSS